MDRLLSFNVFLYQHQTRLTYPHPSPCQTRGMDDIKRMSR